MGRFGRAVEAHHRGLRHLDRRYLINNDQRRRIEERLAKPQHEKRAEKMHETALFLCCALVSLLAAIATLIAVLPIIAGYFK
jgi:hypothetical protein